MNIRWNGMQARMLVPRETNHPIFGYSQVSALHAIMRRVLITKVCVRGGITKSFYHHQTRDEKLFTREVQMV